MVLVQLYGYMQKKNETRPLFLHHIQKYTQWIKYLIIRPNPIKLPEEKIGNKLFGMGLSHTIWDMSPTTKATKANLNK